MHKRSLPNLDPFIRLIEGEGGDGGDTGGGKTGDGEQGKTGGAGDEGKGGDDGGSGDDTGKDDEGDDTGGSGDDTGKSSKGKSGFDWMDDPRAKKYISELRDENAKARKKADADRENLIKGLRKALGDDADQDETDPAKLAQSAVKERDAANERAAGLVREVAVLRAVGSLGVDGDRLLDSRSFERDLAALDPDSDKFADEVKTLIEAAAKRDPSIKTEKKKAPPANGERMGGEKGGGNADRADGVEARRAALRKARGAD